MLFYNDLRKTSPWLHKHVTSHADFFGCALNARRPAPEITKQQLCALKSRNATHGFAHLLEPCNPIPGQNEQAGSEVCELAILMSSTKARQQTRQRITLSQCYTKAHKQQQTYLFLSHPIFLDFQVYAFCGFIVSHATNLFKTWVCLAHQMPRQYEKNECQKTDESWRVPSV